MRTITHADLVHAQIANAIAWIDGLRHAEELGIKQGHGRLGDSCSGFCAFGFGTWNARIPYSPWSSLPPDQFWKSVGLLNQSGMSNQDGRLSITSMNDKYNLTFPQIAQRLIDSPFNFFDPLVAKGVRDHYQTSTTKEVN